MKQRDKELIIKHILTGPPSKRKTAFWNFKNTDRRAFFPRKNFYVI